MRHGVLYRWTLVGLCVLSVGLLGWSPPAGAQLTGTGTTTVVGDTGTLAAGTVDALDSTGDSASIPSLLTADSPSASVIGYSDEIDAGSSLAALNLTFAGVTIAADSVVATATAPLGAAWGMGTSYVDNLSVNGVSVPVDGSVNQTVAIPGGQLVINEQQLLADGTLVVNALHATVSGVADVVVASATAGNSGGDAAAARATTL